MRRVGKCHADPFYAQLNDWHLQGLDEARILVFLWQRTGLEPTGQASPLCDILLLLYTYSFTIAL
jgi:hypothetical protein